MSVGELFPVVAMLVSGVVVGFTGFGFSIVVVPMLALWSNASDAVILALIVGSIVSLIAGTASRAIIHRRSLCHLLVGSVPGLAVGIMLAGALNEQVLWICVGVVTLGAAGLLLPAGKRYTLPSRPPATLAVGTVSGGLTSLLGMGGPPVVAYLLANPGTAERTRATVLAYVAATGTVAVALHGFSGGLRAEHAVTAGLYLIPAMLGVAVGARIYRSAPSLHRPVNRFVFTANPEAGQGLPSRDDGECTFKLPRGAHVLAVRLVSNSLRDAHAYLVTNHDGSRTFLPQPGGGRGVDRWYSVDSETARTFRVSSRSSERADGFFLVEYV